MATAFSIDFLVMMSRGRMFLRIASIRTFADFPAESAFSGSGEAICEEPDRKSTRLNSSHGYISYAVFCLKNKKNNHISHSRTLRRDRKGRRAKSFCRM